MGEATVGAIIALVVIRVLVVRSFPRSRTRSRGKRLASGRDANRNKLSA